MEEDNDFPHRSGTPNRMPACGHDGHTTMLLGGAAAKALGSVGVRHGAALSVPATSTNGLIVSFLPQ